MERALACNRPKRKRGQCPAPRSGARAESSGPGLGAPGAGGMDSVRSPARLGGLGSFAGGVPAGHGALAPLVGWLIA